MANQEKVDKVRELKELMERSKGVFLSDFTGLNVMEMSDLRTRLRAASIRIKVVKNTLASIAAKEAGLESLLPYLTGSVAMAFSEENPIQGIRILSEFAKEKEKPKILGGTLWGESFGPLEIQRLSTLPSRETLLIQISGVLRSPLLRFLSLLNSPLVRFLFLLKELEKVKATEKNLESNVTRIHNESEGSEKEAPLDSI